MKRLITQLAAVALFTPFVLDQPARAKTADEFDVVAACKTECPQAKNNAEAHECAERKGKIRPSFKKTKCWEVNEEYEKLVEAAAPKAGKQN